MWALLERFARTIEHDPTVLEDVGAMRERQRPRYVLLDEQDRGAARVDRMERLEDQLHHDGREAQARLVQQIFSIIRDIKEQGTTILLVEQNALQALTIADRGYVLQTGQVVLAGPAAELREDETVRKAYLGEI